MSAKYPTDADIIAAMREAKSFYERQGMRFKTLAEAQANDYKNFTHDDKRKAIFPTSRAAVRLAQQFPDAQIGL